MTTSAGADKTLRTTNADFAARTHVSTATASKLRTGGRLPSTDLLRRIILIWDLDAMAALGAHARGPAVFSAWLRVHVFDDPRRGDKEIAAQVDTPKSTTLHRQN
jgi:transcriptional regulator with XRE-family HTH domain